MKDLRLIAGLFIAAAFFVGCAVSSDPGEESIFTGICSECHTCTRDGN
jgi:hypothetical protein